MLRPERPPSAAQKSIRRTTDFCLCLWLERTPPNPCRSPQICDTEPNRPPKKREYFCGGDKISRHGVGFLRLSDGFGRTAGYDLRWNSVITSLSAPAGTGSASRLCVRRIESSRHRRRPQRASDRKPARRPAGAAAGQAGPPAFRREGALHLRLARRMGPPVRPHHRPQRSVRGWAGIP